MGSIGVPPSYICTVLDADTVNGQLAQLKEGVGFGATAVEIQLDALASFRPEVDIPKLLATLTVPAIVSYRSKVEGGRYDGSDAAKLAVLKQAYELGVDFIEVGLELAPDFVKSCPKGVLNITAGVSTYTPSPTRIVAASYFLADTPPSPKLKDTLKKLQASGAEVVKIVTKANDICDNKRLFDLLGASKMPTIAVALGPRGELSRLLAQKYGGFATYAYLPAQAELPTVHDYVNVYQARRFDQDTKVFGVLGKPIAQSRGYLLYNAGMIAEGFNGVYLPFLVDDVSLFFETFTDFAGFSVTAPHKQWAIKCVRRNDPAALAIGAISAIFREEDGSTTGYNMDWGAAIYAVEEGLRQREGLADDGRSPLADRLLVLVGAGGAGRGLAYGVKERGGRLAVADLDEERAKEVASTFGGDTVALAELRVPGVADVLQRRFGQGLTRAPVLCHATPVGMKPNVTATPFYKESLGGWAVVFDAVYNPAETRLMSEAKAAGATPVSGVEMFVREAEEQFTLFTAGLPAPGDVMRDVLIKNLAV